MGRINYFLSIFNLLRHKCFLITRSDVILVVFLKLLKRIIFLIHEIIFLTKNVMLLLVTSV